MTDNTPWPQDFLDQMGSGLCSKCSRVLDDHAGLLEGRPQCPTPRVKA